MFRRILLLLPTTTYKATDFLRAAERLEVEVVVGSERRQALEGVAPGHTLTLDFSRPDRAARTVIEEASRSRIDGVIGADDETVLLAAMVAGELGLPHNPVDAVRAARNKFDTRQKLAAAGLQGPAFRLVPIDAPPTEAARQAGFPCVLKPLTLSASRGVLRADDREQFVEAFGKVAGILRREARADRSGLDHLLVEDYLDGPEFALDGLLDDGRLRVLALFDKPGASTGPTFEETLYVTPSKRSAPTRADLARETELGCRALGLVHGPVHAELRWVEGRPILLEIAPRSIGGLCSRALRFSAGISLEELILRHALGDETAGSLEGAASGVMMIPIPRAGVLRGVRGLARARATPNIEEITLTIHRGGEVVPLPEGRRYLGFIFARACTPDQVERSLRDAHARIRFDIA